MFSFFMIFGKVLILINLSHYEINILYFWVLCVLTNDYTKWLYCIVNEKVLNASFVMPRYIIKPVHII